MTAPTDRPMGRAVTAVLECPVRKRSVRARPWKRLSVLVVGLTVLGLVCWRAAQSPLGSWSAGESTGTLPTGVSVLFGMPGSDELRGVPSIQILQVEALASHDAVEVRFWSVPVPAGTDYTGALDTSTPPPGWAQRVPADGSVLRADVRRQLLIGFRAQDDGAASVDGIRIRYRTPDGFVHVVTNGLNMSIR